MASLKKRHEEFIRELQAPLKHSVLLLEHNGRKFPDSVSLDEQKTDWLSLEDIARILTYSADSE